MEPRRPREKGSGGRIAPLPAAWYEETERILQTATIRVRGGVSRSSNNALLVEVGDSDDLLAIYKPARAARPLWDFDRNSLHKRELAAYLVAKALGWMFVPPTVIRDGPQGEGALQLYIHPRGGRHYFEFAGDPRYADDLMRVCAFDMVVNNADRKAGHCFLDSGGRLWSVDHGTCLHVEDKLKTVIWEFGGMPIPDAIATDLRGLATLVSSTAGGSTTGPLQNLEALLEPEEIRALYDRIVCVLEIRSFPSGGEFPSIPWPPI